MDETYIPFVVVGLLTVGAAIYAVASWVSVHALVAL